MRLIDDQREVFAHLPSAEHLLENHVTPSSASIKAVPKGRIYSMLDSICL